MSEAPSVSHSPAPASEPRRRGKLRTPVIAVLLAVVVGAGGWGVWRWATYPIPPDAATSSTEAMAGFIKTDDFHRLTHDDQRRYMLAYIDKLGELSLAELLQRAILSNEQQRTVLGEFEEAGLAGEALAAAHAMVLDKYWSLSPEQREGFLTLLVLADPDDRIQGGNRNSPDTIRQQMAGVMQHQSPEVQGQMGQFLIDLERRRKELRQGPLFGGL